LPCGNSTIVLFRVSQVGQLWEEEAARWLPISPTFGASGSVWLWKPTFVAQLKYEAQVSYDGAVAPPLRHPSTHGGGRDHLRRREALGFLGARDSCVDDARGSLGPNLEMMRRLSLLC
ncbi:hypothetical protein BHM03_00061167, partial [Ensete ventricosum]